jgi:hypothetical protein
MLLETIKYNGPRTPLEAEFNDIVRKFRADNAKLSNPWGMPSGFFRVTGRSGAQYGLGFRCVRCGLEQKRGAENPKGVKHCGRVDKVPTNWLKRMWFFLWLKTWVPTPRYR